ncbi:MAG: ABC transporter ATP-binding protein [Pseudomonadota bacterium]
MPILSVESLTMRFGGLVAVNELSFQVEAGEIRGLIGPNGAGKTTTFNAISGFYSPTSGRILFKGEPVSGLRMSAVAEKGLVRTFQHATLFQEFSLLDNVLVGCHLHHRPGLVASVLGTDRAQRRQMREKALEALEFFGLAERKDVLAGELPHGLQRALGMAVALAAEPEVLLLDEPFTGMNPEETRQMMELMLKIQKRGITLLLVEHDMQAVMGLCNYITVLNFGCLLVEGTPEEIRKDPQVIEAYLGAPGHAA